MDSKYKNLKQEETDQNSLYVHVPKNIPLHLHIDHETDHRINAKKETNSSNNSCFRLLSKNVPWIPPPGKTTPVRKNNLINEDGNKRCKGHEIVRPISPNQTRNCNSSSRTNEDYLQCDQSINDYMKPAHENLGSVETNRQIQTSLLCNRLENDYLFSRTRPMTSPPAIETADEDCYGGMHECIRKMERSTDMIASAVRDLVRNGDLDQAIWDIKAFEILVSQIEVLRKSIKELSITNSRKNSEDELHTTKNEIRDAQHRCEVEILKTELAKAKIEMDQAKEDLAQQENENRQGKAIQSSLETLKRHLQHQLQNRESECSRLSTQLRGLEMTCCREREKQESHVREAERNAKELKEKLDTVKQAARGQKRRAERAEHRLAEMEEKIVQLQNSMEIVRNGAISRRDPDIDQLKELTEKLVEADRKTPRAQSLLSGREKEIGSLEKENKALRDSVRDYEERMASTESEVGKLRSALVETQSRLHDYRSESEAHWKQLQLMEQVIKPSDTINTNAHNLSATDLDDRYRLLESTVDDLRAQLALNRKEAQDAERDHTSRITDLRAQLLQSDSANHSLQAYLTFLKNSYSNIFDGGEATTVQSNQSKPINSPIEPVAS